MLLVGGAAIWFTLRTRPRAAQKQRLQQIGTISQGSNEGGGTEKAESRRQKRIQEKIKKLGDKGEKKGFIEGIQDGMLQAGIDIPVAHYFLGSAIIGMVGPIVYMTMGFSLIGSIPVGVIVGLLLPKLVLGNIAKRRQKKFTASFADAIDIIVRGIRSGLPINECFYVIAREFPPPIGEEFRLFVEGQNLGIDTDDLLAKGLRRIPTSEYKFFAIVTQIQKQTGGNLADTLSNLSTVLRERKKMRDKAQAMSSEAKSSAGIIGSLPFIVAALLSVANPEYLMLLFTQETGNYMLMFGGFWMFLGSMIMKKMINFDM